MAQHLGHPHHGASAIVALCAHYTEVFYLVVMLLYIFLELPAIQLFAVHRKRSEANFIRRYHLVMFALTLFCITFQVLVHSSHRYGDLYSAASPPTGAEKEAKEKRAATQPHKRPSSEKLRPDAARPPSPAPALAVSPAANAAGARPASPAPATTAAAAASPHAATQRLAPPAISAAHRGLSTPALKRSVG